MNMEGSNISNNLNLNKSVSRIAWDRRDKVFSLRGRQLEQITLTQSEINILLRQGEKTAVDLSENKLQQLNVSFLLHFPQQLGSITKLDLSRNEITYMPADLDKLTYLTHLNLYGNNIRILVPCMANMRSLSWLNLNRNPINSISLSFRKVAGPMQTHDDCREAAASVVSWMQETQNFLKFTSQQQVLDSRHGHGHGHEDKDTRLHKKMRNLASSLTTCTEDHRDGYKLVSQKSSTRFKVIHPPGVPPILIKADTEPLILQQVPARTTRGGFGMKSYIFFATIFIILTALVIPADTFQQTISTYFFFLPCVLTKLVTGSHSMVQSFILYWFPKLDTQIFLRVATECLVNLIRVVTGTAFDCIRSGIL